MKKSEFKDFSTVREKVLFLLKEIPKLRDSDNDLIATYIFKEIGQEINEMSALDLLAKISNNKLTSFETIRRCRIEIQKINPKLKGVEFGKKKKVIETPLFKVNIKE